MEVAKVAERNLSPGTAAVTPGIGKIFFSILMSSVSDEPLPMDFLENDYSPLADVYYSFAGSATMVTMATIWPGFDTTNTRMVVIIPPRGNTNSVVLKGVTGDTGITLNPNGISVVTLPSSPASTWGLTVATATTGFRFLFL